MANGYVRRRSADDVNEASTNVNYLGLRNRRRILFRSNGLDFRRCSNPGLIHGHCDAFRLGCGSLHTLVWSLRPLWLNVHSRELEFRLWRATDEGRGLDRPDLPPLVVHHQCPWRCDILEGQK